MVTIPVAILLAFIPLQLCGRQLNIMSLGGIAIACGELVDAAIVVVEQTHKKLEESASAPGSRASTSEVIVEAVKEVGRAELLRAAGDRGVVPAGADAGRRRKAGCSGRWPTPRTSR